MKKAPAANGCGGLAVFLVHAALEKIYFTIITI